MATIFTLLFLTFGALQRIGGNDHAGPAIPGFIFANIHVPGRSRRERFLPWFLFPAQQSWRTRGRIYFAH